MFESYAAGISIAYRGELAGEHLYRGLAYRATNPARRAKLLAIANVEGLTHRSLQPIAQRLGIAVADADWEPLVERRAHELGALSWSAFIEHALRDWPPYIARFEALRSMAPADDRARMQFLVDHEVALVEFARSEQAALTDHRSTTHTVENDAQVADVSLKILEAFLRSGP